MKKRQQFITTMATTHVDLHGERFAKELLEEFAADIVVSSFIAKSSFEHKGKIFSLKAYNFHFSAGEPANLSLTEHSAWRWASLDEIEKIDFVPSDRALFPALKTYLNHQI